MILEFLMKKHHHIIFAIFLLYSSLMAQVNKSGNIDGEVWTAADSLYLITGDIVVIQLTIEPGVVIQFDGNYKFEVRGTLQAEGFFSDSIYFQPNPGNQDGWQGIKFRNTAISSSLKYCLIEGASKDGINIDQAQPQISNCRIVHNNGNGIIAKGKILPIQNCILANNALNGFRTNNARVSILNSIISNNQNSGILSSNKADSVILINSVVADNQVRGVDCPNGSVKIRNSIIYHNTVQINPQNLDATITYSDIQDTSVFPGTGNINSDPQFLDHSLYTLSPQSPCIDGGDTILADSDRYFPPSMGSSRNDMGAYGGPQAFGWYPPLYIRHQMLDFNRVPQDSSQSIILEILNYRDEGITISGLAFEGDENIVFSGKLSNNYILNSDSAELTVTFKPQQEKIYTSALLFQTASQGTLSLPLQGEGVLPHINIALSELNFGQIPAGEDITLNLPVQNTGGDTLQIDLIQPSNTAFQVEPASFKMNPDSSSDTINVTFTPDLVKTYQDSLVMLTNDREKTRIVILLTGEGLGPKLHISTSSLNFDSVAVLSDTILTISISNQGYLPLDIDSLKLIQSNPLNETFSIADTLGAIPIRLEPDKKIIISVQFSPKARGVQSGYLLIYYSDPFPKVESVDLIGTGLGAEIVLSTSELDFGETLIISDSTQILNIENIGNSTLIIEDFYIDPPDSCFEVSNEMISLPFDIGPGSSTDFPIKFMPVDTGKTDGQITIISNDPFNHESFVSLTGRGSDSGLIPFIELSVDSLQFNQVDTSSYSQKSFYIYNRGYVDLVIPEDSIYIAESVYDAFSIINIPEYISIHRQDSLEITIRFKPKKFGPDQADLRIKSNDLLHPLMIVRLSGTGVGEGYGPKLITSAENLEFTEVDTNSFILRSLYLYNLGYTDLFIPGDSIFITYSENEAFFILNHANDITIAPLDSQEIVIRFEPPELGQYEANLWIKSNDPLNPVVTVFLTGIGLGNGSSEISYDPFTSTNPLINRQAATLGFEITSFIPIDSAFVFVRRGGSTSFTAFLLRNIDGTNIWSADIDPSLITERGVEYYVRVSQSHTISIYPQNGERNPNAVSVQIPYLAFPDNIPGEIYRMISVPLNTQGQTLSDLFLDDLGTYNENKYRIFDCTDGFAYSEISDLNTALPPGKSVWFITKEPAQLDVQNGVSILTDDKYLIELHQGWNMIASPFPFPVSWEGLGSGLALRYFDGADWPFVIVMNPFEGYAVKAVHDTVISVNALESSIPKSLPKFFPPDTSNDWSIQISAECDHFKDQFNFVGVLNTAEDGLDRHDYPEPMPIGEYVSLYLLSPESKERLSTDFRQPDANGYIFDIEVNSNIKSTKIIQLIPRNLPENFDWRILNTETKVDHGKNLIRSSLSEASYELIVGSSDFINEMSSDYKSLPKHFKLAQNYPNPFNPRTTISYQIPVSSDVNLSIYNILGEKVVTLLSREQEPGYYRLEWNGLNQSGQRVSSGIYFLHLQTKQFNQTIKMILQR